mmetsp:Transcript_24010/g.71803  ORF Transcript_24010/g.71803 Transcript_24010/m.71803 type:complete len:245 (-) Transcript_24010:1373-2107(-)
MLVLAGSHGELPHPDLVPHVGVGGHEEAKDGLPFRRAVVAIRVELHLDFSEASDREWWRLERQRLPQLLCPLRGTSHTPFNPGRFQGAEQALHLHADVVGPTVHVPGVGLVIPDQGVELRAHPAPLRLERSDGVTMAVGGVLQDADVLGHLLSETDRIIPQGVQHLGGRGEAFLCINLHRPRGRGRLGELPLRPILLLRKAGLEEVDLLLRDVVLHVQVAEIHAKSCSLLLVVRSNPVDLRAEI